MLFVSNYIFLGKHRLNILLSENFKQLKLFVKNSEITFLVVSKSLLNKLQQHFKLNFGFKFEYLIF